MCFAQRFIIFIFSQVSMYGLRIGSPAIVKRRKETIMNCPLVKGKYMLSCGASAQVYVPSRFELDEYCKNTRYKICPFYFKALSDGKIKFSQISESRARRVL